MTQYFRSMHSTYYTFVHPPSYFKINVFVPLRSQLDTQHQKTGDIVSLFLRLTSHPYWLGIVPLWNWCSESRVKGQIWCPSVQERVRKSPLCSYYRFEGDVGNRNRRFEMWSDWHHSFFDPSGLVIFTSNLVLIPGSSVVRCVKIDGLTQGSDKYSLLPTTKESKRRIPTFFLILNRGSQARHQNRLLFLYYSLSRVM